MLSFQDTVDPHMCSEWLNTNKEQQLQHKQHTNKVRSSQKQPNTASNANSW
jgi:hypothetical protein